MKIFFYLLLLIGILLGLSACMTSSQGSLFRDTYGSYHEESGSGGGVPADDDPDDADNHAAGGEDNNPYDDEDEYEYVEEEVPGLSILTDPSYADVYLNGSYAGSTPLVLDNLTPGYYSLRLEREGFYPETHSLIYDGGREEIYIDLDPITGYLAVEVNVPGAEVWVEGARYRSFPAELQIGTHRLSVRAFGFEEYIDYISIAENRMTRVSVLLDPAAFALEGLRASRELLNPENAGMLGTTRLAFRVTSFGSARLQVFSPAGEEIVRYEFERFTTWAQSCLWNGRDEAGLAQPDGIYRVVLEGWGEDGRSQRLETRVTLDRSYSLSPRMIWTGTSGLVYVATPGVLPPGGVQLSSHALVATGRDTGGELVFIAPLNSGLRFGLPGAAELNLSFSPVLLPGEELPFTVSGSYKRRLFAAGRNRLFQGGLVLRGSYVHATNVDTYTNFTGLSLGLPLAVDGGAVALVAEPELTLSPYRVLYDSPAVQEPGFHAWLYGKLGLQLDLGSVVLGLSGSVRSLPLAEGWGFDPPYNGALELHLLIPGTGLFFSVVGAMEFISVKNYYINYGIGVSALH